MRTINWWWLLMAVGFLSFAGCKKAEAPVTPATEFNGVKVDLPKLEAEFASSSQEAQERVLVTKRFFRYGQFPRAVPELEALSKIPNLSEAQKKLVNDVIDQTRQIIARAPAALPGQ